MLTTFDDPNIECRNEYNCLVDVYYRGEAFTGTIKDGLETINYKDGKVHGQYTIHHGNGQLRSDELYENGEIVTSKTYYENGQKETELVNNSYQKWTINGVLIQKDKEHYFENGCLRILYSNADDDFAIKYFTPEGDWLYTQRKDIWVDNAYKRTIDYNHKLMYKWYDRLLDKVIADDAENHRVHHIWMWFWEVFERDQNKYFKIVNHLLEHSNEEVIKSLANIVAIHKFQPYIRQENEKNRNAYRYIKEYSEYHDKRDPNRDTRKVNL